MAWKRRTIGPSSAQGVFAEAVEGIKAAKAAGFLVCTNTTIYKETDMHEIAVLLGYLTELGVDGFMMSPAYGYAAVQSTNPLAAQQIFMTRDDVHEKFRQAKKLLAGFRLNTSPVYLEFLRGERELRCAAWANPTRNVRGWKGPCYLITDAHYESYHDLVERDRLGQAGPGQRSALRALHGPLRLRAGGRAGRESPPGRHAQNGPLAVELSHPLRRTLPTSHHSPRAMGFPLAGPLEWLGVVHPFVLRSPDAHVATAST